MKIAIFLSILLPLTILGNTNKDINFSKKDNTILLVDKIEKLYISNKLNKAKELAAISVKKYPNSINLHILYAKLLFWTKREAKALKEINKYKKYNYKLYKDIYITWAINKLNKIKDFKKRLKFIKHLHKFAQNSYDICWISIESYIKLKEFKNALAKAKCLSRKYPKSREAQERYAQLLFWNAKYKNSLKEYLKLRKKYGNSYKKNIRQLKRIINAKKTINKKIISKKNFIPKRKQIDIEVENKLKYMLGIGFENAVFSDKRYKDNTKYIEATLPIKSYILYLKLEDTNRYGLNDKKIYGEFYPKFSSNYWGYLSFSYSPKSLFYAKYSIAWNQYYVWDKWQFGLSYELRKYTKETLHTVTLEYIYYFSDYLFLKEQLTYVLNNKSFSHLLQFKYQNLNHLEFYFNYIYSKSYEKEENSSYWIKSNTIEVGGEYPINKYLSIGAKLSKSWFKRDYKKNSINIFLRYYW